MKVGLKCHSSDMGMPPAAVMWKSSGNNLNVTEEGRLGFWDRDETY